MRLINESEAIKNIEQFCDIPRYAKDEAEQIIRETNTVDAVPAVRCGECTYCEENCSCVHYFGCNIPEESRVFVEPDDFCSYGERKDGEK